MLNATDELLRLLPTTMNGSESDGLPGGSYSDADNLTELYGPKRDPLYVVIPITIVYLVIFITGVVGNISTCIVIARNRSMHTATNYYLFSLAISDFLLLVSGVPQEIYFIWSKYPYVFGETFCVLRGIAAETSANATVLTITAFTVERYVAICHPFLSHTMSKLSRAIRFIFVIWLIAIVSAVPQALQFGVTSQAGIDQCVVKRIIIQHSFELSTFLFFFAPMTLITVLYALIGLKLRSSTLMQRDGTLQRRNNVAASSRQSSATSQGTRRVLKMLVAVVVAFFICWAPFHAQRLVYIYGVDKDHQPSDPLILQLFVVTTYISGILYYLSTCINPLLYNIMSNKFRQAFKETLANCCQIARQSNSAERSYRILPRRERRSAANKESSDVSGNSIRDESLYSSSTQKQSFDSITLSRGHSLKRPPSTSGGHGGATEGMLFAPQQQQQVFGWGGVAETAALVPECVVEGGSVLVGASRHGRSELDLYTQDRELQLNIFSGTSGGPPGVGGGTLGHGVAGGGGSEAPGESQQLARISIQVNRVNRDEGEGLTPEVAPGGRSSRHARRPDSLRLLCRQPRGQDGRVEIFVRSRQRQRQRGRVRLLRFFQQVRQLRQGGPPLDGKELASPGAAAVVHFFGPIRPIAELEGEASTASSVSAERADDGVGVSCGSSIARGRYYGYPNTDCATVSTTLEDDLDAYMREIKLRETTIR
ncbi:uncharacterized protein LOC131290577 [Anopheles ziemanni]|uniref:uncharacterized protein LOC131268870 n=1 Tax=Anopheles coustani TaxID=139045 RepID=UPI0026588B5B|nr:uncharacterized protein LOC131268870 [Anopheles coustani]XP_058175718.1 uncharacterized protein LOC131290577 [Anopheles ziemanni]